MNKAGDTSFKVLGPWLGSRRRGYRSRPKRPQPASKPRVRIATEEAMAPPELLADYRAMLASDEALEPGFRSTVAGYLGNEFIDSRLVDIGEGRIRHMDANGITMHVLSIVPLGARRCESGGYGAPDERSTRCCRCDRPLYRPRGYRPTGTARSVARARAECEPARNAGVRSISTPAANTWTSRSTGPFWRPLPHWMLHLFTSPNAVPRNDQAVSRRWT